MITCPHCGEENENRELYCGRCHERLPSLSSLRSLMRSGLEYMEQKNYRMALERFDELVEKNPGDMDGWFLKSSVHMRMGNGTQAWKTLVQTGLAEETGRCPKCKGTSKCSECGSTGICIMCRGTKKCSYCGGSGVCPTCKGINPEDCNHCKGTGECIRCKGTKECTYCNGFGSCYKCRGSGSCSYCGGTGKGHRILMDRISDEFGELKNWFV